LNRIRIPNPDLSRSEKTFLDADYTSGTSLTVVQNYGFQDNDIVVLGEPGEEKTEWRDCTGITGRTIISVATAYDFDHAKATPVYRSEWSRADIERKTGTSGSWAAITQSALQWDKQETIYIDNDGTDDHYYRFRFYNIASGLYSDYSPTIAGSGLTRKQVGYMVSKVRRKIKDPDKKRVSDDEIIDLFQEAQDIIKAIRANWWFLKVDTYKADNGISTAASTGRYSLATYTDLIYLERVRFRYNYGNDDVIYDLEPKDEVEFDYETRDLDRDPDDYVKMFKQVPPDSSSARGYIEVEPVPENASRGTFYPEYYKELPTLNDIADETSVPIPQVLEDYACWKIFQDMGLETKAAVYRKLFYGPSPADKDRDELTGIALLEQMNKNQGIAVGMPKQLFRYAGRKALKRLYGERTLDRDSIAEKYF